MVSHPPAPGGFVTPNLSAIEEAIRPVTFPISKRDLLDQLADEDTVVLNGRNLDLRTLVKDLHDDFFDNEDEFRSALESEYGALAGRDAEVLIVDAPPTGFPEDVGLHTPGAEDQPALPRDNA